MDRALDPLEAETAAKDWLLRNRDAINQSLDISFAQSERGEVYSPEQARTLLAERRAIRQARPTPQP